MPLEWNFNDSLLPAGTILGVSVRGPEPLGWNHLMFNGPTISLYGKNGVGKTRLLQAIAAGLEGISLDNGIAMVHVATNDVTVQGSDWTRAVLEQMKSNLADARGNLLELLSRKASDESIEGRGERAKDSREQLNVAFDDAFGSEYSPESIQEAVYAHLDILLFPQIILDDDHVIFQGFADLVAGSGVVSLLATGTEERPKWDVLQGALMNESRYRDSALGAVHTKVANDSVIAETKRLVEAGLIEDAAQMLRRFSQPSRIPWEEASPIWGGILDGVEDWPTWAPLPFIKTAEIYDSPAFAVTEQTSQVVDMRSREVFNQLDFLVDAASDDELIPSREATELERSVGATATEIIRQLIGDQYSLKFDFGIPRQWFNGDLAHWSMRNGDTGEWFVLSQASTAEQRWASLAAIIALKHSTDPDGSAIVLLDEPESGLHPSALDRLPSVLESLAEKYRIQIVLATHAPVMLNYPDASPVHVYRFRGKTQTSALLVSLAEFDGEWSREDLGLTRSDLLQMVRTFVLVEGTHDKIVIETLFESELRDSQAAVLAIRGAKELVSVIQASVLFDYTDANFVLVIDGVDPSSANAVIDKARAALSSGAPRAAEIELRKLRSLDGQEVVWLEELLRRAVQTARLERLTVSSLPQFDIVAYLPVAMFVKEGDWTSLKIEYDTYKRGARSRNEIGDNFKQWLRRTRSAIVNNATVKSAAEVARGLVDGVHPDLIRVAEDISSAGSRTVRGVRAD